MRPFLFLAYYALACLLGFALRSRFDRWMYTRPHMQHRLVIYASATLAAVERGDDAVTTPPDTADADAWSPVLLGTPLARFVRSSARARHVGEAADIQQAAAAAGSVDQPPVPADEGPQAPPAHEPGRDASAEAPSSAPPPVHPV